MAQFDVFRLGDGGLVLDCQADVFGFISSRVTAPLVPLSESPDRQPRLNPIFAITGEDHVLMTQFAAAIRTSELKVRIESLIEKRLTIINAFDTLLTGN